MMKYQKLLVGDGVKYLYLLLFCILETIIIKQKKIRKILMPVTNRKTAMVIYISSYYQ